jgi:putative flavoprotein involved in K+ transport
MLRFVFHRVMTLSTPVGRKARPSLLTHAMPLLRVQPRHLVVAGVQRAPRTVGVCGGKPLLEDRRVLDVANVIWCTGFEPDFGWIDLPVHGPHEPLHVRGVVPSQPGLYFVGLHFLYAASSGQIHGVARDAEHIVNTIQAQTRKVAPGRAPIHPRQVTSNEPRSG